MGETRAHRSKWFRRTAPTSFMEAPSSNTTVRSSTLLISIQTILDVDAWRESSASSVNSEAALVVHFIYRASVKVVQQFTAAGIGRSSFSLTKDCAKTRLRCQPVMLKRRSSGKPSSMLVRVVSLPEYLAAAVSSHVFTDVITPSCRDVNSWFPVSGCGGGLDIGSLSGATGPISDFWKPWWWRS